MDESLKEVYVECVGAFGWGEVDVEYAADGDSTRVDKEGGECYTFIHSRVMLQATLSYLKSIVHFAGPAFWGPEYPPPILEEGGIRFKSAMAWTRIAFKVL